MNQLRAGVVLSYLSQIIQILSSLIYTPIMLRLLGQSEYGLYQLVASVVSYLGLLSFGFNASYMRFYSKMHVKKDEDGIAKLNGMFMTIFLCISCVCILCGIVMISNIEAVFGKGLSENEFSIARALMALMILNLALTFPSSVFDAITSSKEKFVFQKTLIVCQNILNPFITLPFLVMGYGSIAMVMITTLLTVGKLGVNMCYCLRYLQVRFSFKGFDFKLLKEMWVFTFFIFLNMIVDQINWSVDKFLLGRYAGTIAVAIYGIGGQINTLYLQLSTTVSGVFVPKVNRIVAESNDNEVLTNLFTKVGRIQFIILALIVSGFCFFGKEFIAIWAGSGYESSYRIALFLMVPVTVPLIQNIGIEIQRAKNMHKVRSIVYLLIAISNIFVSIPCIKRWGPEGAAVGTALTLMFGNGFFMNWYYHRKIGIDIIYFWRKIIAVIPALIIPCMVGVGMKAFFKEYTVMTMLLGIIVYCLTYGFSMYLFGMNQEERKILTDILNKVIKR